MPSALSDTSESRIGRAKNPSTSAGLWCGSTQKLSLLMAKLNVPPLTGLPLPLLVLPPELDEPQAASAGLLAVELKSPEAGVRARGALAASGERECHRKSEGRGHKYAASEGFLGIEHRSSFSLLGLVRPRSAR